MRFVAQLRWLAAGALLVPCPGAPAQQPVTRPLVEAFTLPAPPPLRGRKDHYTVTVDAAKDWVDTGIPLAAGDQLSIKAEGSMLLGNGETITAAGKEHFWRDLLRQYPLPTAKTGALIGRVGDNAAAFPFPVGAGSEVAVHASGNLFLRSNLSDDMPGKGTLKVTVRLAAATAATASAAPVTQADAARFNALPRRNDDGAGNVGDAVNFAFIGTEQQVRDAFARSGWFAVDADQNTALLHGLLATLSREPYREVPMSRLFLFGRPQDMSFARGDALRVAAVRHHLRLWKTADSVSGRPLWVGSATFDNGFERDQRTGGVTHSIAPEIDTERDFLRDSLVSSGSVAAAAYVTPQNAVREAKTATGGSFHSDGRVLLITLQ